MRTPFDQLAQRYHQRLPGIIRATLVDHGLSNEVIDRRSLGWHRESVTVPVPDATGHVAFFEMWDAAEIGIAGESSGPVELYPRQALTPPPARLIIAEGIHEALIFESHGFPAACATGSGLFFKAREWGPLLQGIPEVVLAYRRGEYEAHRGHLPGRAEVSAWAKEAVPRAQILEWPEEVGDGGGAYEFFVSLQHTAEDFRRLLRSCLREGHHARW
jgi:hypothetical protein